MGFLLQFFMSPLFLVGISSASIPIVIHLIHRRKAPKLLFSTLRFLRVSNERTSRRQHLQDIFLLLLRALICALLAIALARPFLPASSTMKGPVAAAIVLDNSLSMSAEDEGQARFAVAKQVALDVLRDLGSRASAVMVATNPPRGRPAAATSSDLAAVERDILGTNASAARGDLPAAVAAARRILDAVAEPNKQIFVVSDLQKNSWSTTPGAAASSGDTPVIILDCGSTDASNAAVTDVAIRGRSRVEGEPITVEARLLNFGPRAVNETATLYIDGQARDRRTLTLAPSVPAAASFTHVFTEPGVHKGWVSIEDDRLKTDNVRSFAVRVQQQLKVLVVQDENAAVSFMDDSYYLLRALDPLRGQADARSPIRPVSVLTPAMSGEKLADYKAVFLVNVATLARAAADSLREYVREGGGLVIFAGGNVQPAVYNEILGDPAGALLPAEFGPAVGNADDHTQFRRVTDVDYTHPLLARFKGEGLFDDVRVFQNVSLKVAGRSAAKLVGLSDGTPFLVENGYENGTVLMFTTSAGTDWSNFPLKQAYLPLLHEITYHVSRTKTVKDSYLVDSLVRMAFPEADAAVAVELTDPAGKVLRVESDQGSANNTAVFEMTSLPGVYTWRAEGQQDEGAFAINPDTRESDLQRLADSDLQAAKLGEKVFVVASVDEMRDVLKRLKEGFPLLDYFFLAVLGIAIFECFFSNWLTPESPREVRKSSLGLVTSATHGEA